MNRDNDVKHPGQVIRELLEERGWTQVDLARIIGRPVPALNEVVQGKRGIGPELALSLGAAFGNGPQFWMNLEVERQLAEANHSQGDEVRRRAALFDMAPVKEMEKRGWIKRTTTAEELETELKRFFGTDDLSSRPTFPLSTRRSTSLEELTDAQRAWCFRARAIAASQIVSAFDDKKLDECADRLRRLAAFAPEARKVALVLGEYGIKFVIVEPLQGAKIDGAAFWIDGAPVIAMSLRFDRIDYFWFTVGHEFSHIKNRDDLSIDTDLVGDEADLTVAKSAVERRADNEAAAMLIPSKTLESFIMRVAPMYSKEKIIQFANRVKIHPGIIVGQLQHRGQIGFHANREMLVKIRDVAISGATVDGWGHSLS